MLTIRAEIKRNEQKADKTFNVKLRFTLDRSVKTHINKSVCFVKRFN